MATWIWTYFEAMKPAAIPKSLLVIGSGAIGIEFASFYRTLGAEVTVVEILEQILPAEDGEIAAFAAKRFEKQGIKIMTGARLAGLSRTAGGIKAEIKPAKGDAATIEVERVSRRSGSSAMSKGSASRRWGVAIDKGMIKVDGFWAAPMSAMSPARRCSPIRPSMRA